MTMASVTEYTKEQIEEILREDLGDRYGAAVEIINHWLGRGDGIAAYQNVELGHPEAGSWKFVSYGSINAQLETEEPPTRLPDIGGDINWRFHLIGIYRGDPLG